MQPWPLWVPGGSRYWELTLRNRDGLGEDVTGEVLQSWG